MRAVGRLATTSVGPNTTKQALLSSYPFSTSSGGGGGRGRGKGVSSPFSPAAGKVAPANDDYDASSGEADDYFPPLGAGRGRGRPLPPPPVTNVFSPWMSSPPASVGRGRSQPPTSPPPPQQPPPDPSAKIPVFFRREDAHSDSASKFDFVQTPEAGGLSRGAGRGQTLKLPEADTRKPVFFRREDAHSDSASKFDFVQTPEAGNIDFVQTPQASVLPPSILQGVRGAGRGQMVKLPETDTRAREENRHLRRGERQPGSPSAPRLNRQEAVEKAVRILRGPAEGGRGRGGRARGRGRGMQGGTGRGGRGGMRPGRKIGVDDGALYNNYPDEVKSKADNALGEIVDSLIEEDLYLEAVDTNFLIEFEPEYAMEEFGTNPDIDDTPPIPLRDALEKAKPFLMAYEGIQSQEEWEEIMKETMATVPYCKQLIDMYAGPDRLTAKQEQEELEKIAKTLPEDVPSSVKRFTDRALLTLQSNPGWEFHQKYQFMDKLVREVTQPMKW